MTAARRARKAAGSGASAFGNTATLPAGGQHPRRTGFELVCGHGCAGGKQTDGTCNCACQCRSGSPAGSNSGTCKLGGKEIAIKTARALRDSPGTRTGRRSSRRSARTGRARNIGRSARCEDMACKRRRPAQEERDPAATDRRSGARCRNTRRVKGRERDVRIRERDHRGDAPPPKLDARFDGAACVPSNAARAAGWNVPTVANGGQRGRVDGARPRQRDARDVPGPRRASEW